MPVETEFHTPPFAPLPTNPIPANLGPPVLEDTHVFAVPHTYAACFGPHDFAIRRVDNGLSFIVVGAEVDDARMRRHLPELRERYGVTPEQLQAARNGKPVCVRSQPAAHT